MTELTLDQVSQRLGAMEARVEALAARVIRKPPKMDGRRRTRLDRTPYGTQIHPKNPLRLTDNPREQEVIRALIEARQDPSMTLRALARQLDSFGYKRRNGSKWSDVGGRSLIRNILRRHNATTPEDARLWVFEQIQAIKAQAAGR